MIHPAGSYLGLDGIVGKFDHLDLWCSTDPFTACVYGIGDLFCHQDEARSLIINGSQMPFCARDFSIFIGVAVALLSWEVLLLYLDPKSRSTVVISFVMILIMIAEWVFEKTGFIDSMFLRILSGMVAGLGIGSLVWAYADHEYGTSTG